MGIKRLFSSGWVFIPFLIFLGVAPPALWGQSTISTQNSPLVNDLLGQEQIHLEGQYAALQQQINDQIKKAYDALQAADEGKKDKGKGLQNAAKALTAIAQEIQMVAPGLSAMLMTLAGVMNTAGQKDQDQADQAQQPMSQGQQASVSDALQQQLADLQAKITALQAARTGTTGAGTSTDAALQAALQQVYAFVLGTNWQQALGINTVSTGANQAVTNIQNNVTGLANQPGLSRSAVRNYQAQLHEEIKREIEQHTEE